MRKLISTLWAGALAASFAVTAFVPAQAAPMMPAPGIHTTNDVTNVDYRWRRGGYYGGGYRDGYYRGDGWRHRNSTGIGVGAAIAGALITGAIINSERPRPIYRERVYRNVGNSHVQYCFNRYRSYRAYDNTFQPYNGPRQQCYSPY